MFLLPAVDLTSVLTPEIMAPILANPEVQQRLMPYLPSGESLPQSTEELNNTLSSPQFQQVCLLPDAPPLWSLWIPLFFCPWAQTQHVKCQARLWLLWGCLWIFILLLWCLTLFCWVFPSSVQAMSMFSSALASGQLGPLMNQFGLPAEAVDAANKGGLCFARIKHKHCNCLLHCSNI